MNLGMRTLGPLSLFIAQCDGPHNHGSVCAPDQGMRLNGSSIGRPLGSIQHFPLDLNLIINLSS
jgi:hypothetical protein